MRRRETRRCGKIVCQREKEREREGGRKRRQLIKTITPSTCESNRADKTAATSNRYRLLDHGKGS